MGEQRCRYVAVSCAVLEHEEMRVTRMMVGKVVLGAWRRENKQEIVCLEWFGV